MLSAVMGTLTFSAPDTFVFRSWGGGGMIRGSYSHSLLLGWGSTLDSVPEKAVVSADGRKQK